jgi:hypothetical protein
MVDLNMPEGMSDDERVRWLQELGVALVRETEQPQGMVEDAEGEHGQPVWAVWWTEEGTDRSR